MKNLNGNIIYSSRAAGVFVFRWARWPGSSDPAAPSSVVDVMVLCPRQASGGSGGGSAGDRPSLVGSAPAEPPFSRF